MSYKLVWEQRGVVLHFSGQITISDIVNASVDYEESPQFDDLLYVIADYSQITGCNATSEHIDDVWIVDRGAKFSNNRIKKAIITTTPEVIAMANRYRSAPDPAFPVKIFSIEAEAREWLNEQ